MMSRLTFCVISLCLLPATAFAQVDLPLPLGAVGCQDVVIDKRAPAYFRECPSASCKRVQWNERLEWSYDPILMARYGDWLLVDSENLLWVNIVDVRVEAGIEAPLRFDPRHACLRGVTVKYIGGINYNNYVDVRGGDNNIYEWANVGGKWRRKVAARQGYPLPVEARRRKSR